MLRRSIVVPLYQESARIAGTVGRLAQSPLHEDGTEFVFVDDGSTDDTLAVLRREIAASGLRAQVLRLPGNRGKGAAVRTGVLAARGAVIAFVDADLSSPPQAILQCLEAVEAGAQVAVASRGHDTSDITVRQPAARESAGKSFNRLVRALGLTTLPDTQCGLKAFDRASALALFRPLGIRRFAFDVEILARAQELGLRVEVIPTQWAHVEQSRVSPLRDGARMAWDAVRVARARRRTRGTAAAAADAPAPAAMSPATFEVMAQVERVHWWFTAKRTLLQEHVDLVLPVGQRRLAVDVGCGTGAVVADLRAAGFGAVVGTDLDLNALRLAGGILPRGAQLVQAVAEALPLPDGRADLLASLDVVEHLDDDVAALAEYLRVLRPGGHLVLTVPAYRWAWSDHDVSLGHRRRYTRAEVEEAAAAAGFVDVRVRYFHSWLVPVAFAVRKTPLRRLGSQAAETSSMGGSWQNALGHGLARADRSVVLPFGLSLFASARRPD